MHLSGSPGLTVFKNLVIFLELHLIKIRKLFKTLLFEFLSFSKTLLFCSFIIFKGTHGTSIPSNCIYFMKTTNEWVLERYGRCHVGVMNSNQRDIK